MTNPEKKSAAAPVAVELKDPNLEFARALYIAMAQRIYSKPSAPDQKKPDPKALAALCFRLAEAFEAAAKETPWARAAYEAASKAAVKLEEVDLSGVFQPATFRPAKT
jgi:hypothetical protein